jgi:hypothetical protein
MRTLILDLETSPNVAHVWGLWDQTVSLAQLRESTRVISFAAKWHGEKRVMFYSDFHNGHDVMVNTAYSLLDDADAIVHYNGTSFDIPHLRREFILAGLTPPSPAKDIDLLQTVKRRFRFVSNKLDHVTRELGMAGKTRHTGHQLWVDCMAGDAKAWALMRKYNQQDVILTEQLYDRLLPWITNHPAVGLYSGDADCCRNCGGTDLERRGVAHTGVSSFQQYRCRACGAWSRGAKRLDGANTRGVS